VVLAVIFAVAAFVRPGFLRSPAAPIEPINDPLALLPEGSNWFIGGDLDRLRSQGMLEPVLAYLMDSSPGLPRVPGERLPPGLAGIVRDLGRSVVITGRAGEEADKPAEDTKPAVMLVTRDPVDMDRVKSVCNAEETTSIHGRTVYRVRAWEKGTTGWLTFPGERLVVITKRPGEELARLLAPGPRPPHPAIGLIVDAQQHPVWGVAYFDESMKNALRKKAPKELDKLTPLVLQGRGAFMHVRFADNAAPDNPWSIEAKLNVVCNRDADAARLAKAGQEVWDETKTMRGLLQLGLGFKNAAFAGLLGDINRETTIGVDGPRATTTLRLTPKTLEQLQKPQPPK
jgi:hypothetical protein